MCDQGKARATVQFVLIFGSRGDFSIRDKRTEICPKRNVSIWSDCEIDAQADRATERIGCESAEHPYQAIDAPTTRSRRREGRKVLFRPKKQDKTKY
jgi:hypothetical protein